MQQGPAAAAAAQHPHPTRAASSRPSQAQAHRARCLQRRQQRRHAGGAPAARRAVPAQQRLQAGEQAGQLAVCGQRQHSRVCQRLEAHSGRSAGGAAGGCWHRSRHSGAARLREQAARQLHNLRGYCSEGAAHSWLAA